MEQSGQMVDCNYRDYSRYLERGGELIAHKKSTNNFPSKLHRMLSDEQHSDVISWMPHGRAFKILNKERFMTEVIPAYLSCIKFESFTRQLSNWGFRRLFSVDYLDVGNEGCYYHECFLRGIPKITCLIRRGKCKSSIRYQEPDFASMLPLPETTKESREKIDGSGVPQHQMRHDRKSKMSDILTSDELHVLLKFREAVRQDALRGNNWSLGAEPLLLRLAAGSGAASAAAETGGGAPGGAADGLSPKTPKMMATNRSQAAGSGAVNAAAGTGGGAPVGGAAGLSPKAPKMKATSRSVGDKPKRPFSAYNLFFQMEREFILDLLFEGKSPEDEPLIREAIAANPGKGGDDANKAKAEDDKTKPPEKMKRPPPKDPAKVYVDPDMPKRYAHLQLDKHWYSVTHKAKRKHRKTEGDVGFTRLTLMVSSRWKRIGTDNPETKEYCQRLYDRELAKYKKAMEEYREKVRAADDGTRRRVNDCPFTVAKKDTGAPEADRPPIMVGDSKLTAGHAQAYLNEVRNAFLEKPNVYNEFLELFRRCNYDNLAHDFVVSRANYLLSGHPKLLEGFNAFLEAPPSKEKTPALQGEAPSKSTDDAPSLKRAHKDESKKVSS